MTSSYAGSVKSVLLDVKGLKKYFPFEGDFSKRPSVM